MLIYNINREKRKMIPTAYKYEAILFNSTNNNDNQW